MDLHHTVAGMPHLLVHLDLAPGGLLDLPDDTAASTEEPTDEPLLDLDLVGRLRHLVRAGRTGGWRVQQERASRTVDVRSRSSGERKVYVLGCLVNVVLLAADDHLAVSELLGGLINADADLELPLDLAQGGAASADHPPDEFLLDEIRRLRPSGWVISLCMSRRFRRGRPWARRGGHALRHERARQPAHTASPAGCRRKGQAERTGRPGENNA
mmetsp:Transcript_51134/g.147556  ORF Transcript_51134/g.147556 Transcript_51134/m.147556 type:complete len:214 (-) Transcript_51134:2-643(-)